jgi:hypothetical protein
MRWAVASKALVVLIGATCCLVVVAYAAGGKSPAGGGRKPAQPRPPRPRILKHPRQPALSTSASFAYSSGLAKPSFECRLDDGPWRPCGPRIVYRGLAPGSHTFSVRVESDVGAISRPARFAWVRTAPKGFAIEPQGDLGELFPGAPPVPLPVLLKNPNPAPILVTALRVGLASEPPGCDAGNFELIPSNLSAAAPLRIPAGAAVAVPAAKASAPAVAMRDLSVNQDVCRGAHLPLVFSGEAHG